MDLSTAQKVIVASVVILILLVLLGLFVRQIQGGRLKMKGQSGGRTRQPRLGVVDAHSLDRQRQLILIRRDNVEHLIMIGGASDVVVETNIMRSGARTAPLPVDYAASERPQAFDSLVPPEPVRQDPARQEPLRQEPLRQEPLRQETFRQEPVRQEPLRQEPTRQEPVAVAQPRPDLLPPLPMRQPQAAAPSRPVQSQTQADAALAAVAAAAVPAALAVAESTASSSPAAAAPPVTPTVQPPSFSRDHAPSPAASAVELDNMAKQLEEALKRPFSAVRPANSPGEPAAAAKPAKLPDPVPAEPRLEPEPVAVGPAVIAPLPTPTPPAPPQTSDRPVALPPDVEAELEMALGLRPERIAPPVHGPATSPPEPAPVAKAEPPIEEPVDEKPAEPDADDLMADDDLMAEASEAPEPHAKPAAEPDGKKPQPVAAPVAADPEATAKAPEPEPEQKPAAIDPFSVDAIEAEFARLLGRDPKSKL